MKKNRNKKRLLIFSDLWGWREADWVADYKSYLATDFEIILYDSTVLGKIDTKDGIQHTIHQQFIEGGIERAVQYLLLYEQEPVDVLAFSIGGVIAWKAALSGMRVKRLLAISSTRLRYETEKPNFENCQLYFGAHDPFLPKSAWFERMRVQHQILAGEDHQVYKQKAMLQKYLLFFNE